MLELSKDEKCLKLEQYLDDFALKTNLYWKKHRNYFATGGSKFYVSNHMARDEDKMHNACDNFSNGYANYVLSFEKKEDKQQVAGHFLWYIVNKGYLSSDFRTDALDICSSLIKELSDSDKIKFMEFLFTEPQNKKKSALWHEMKEEDILNLMAFNPNENMSDINRLYTKALSHLDKMPRKSPNLDKKVKLLNDMFIAFTKNIKEITPDAAENLADIYFKLSEKTNESLSSFAIIELAKKTPYANKLAKQSASEFAVDKKFITQVMKNYVAHVNNPGNKEFNDNLARQMVRVVNSANFTAEEINHLSDIIRPNPKLRESKKTRGLSLITNILENKAATYVNNRHPFAIINSMDSQEMYSDKVTDYATALFTSAKKYPYKKFNTSSLYELLTSNDMIDKSLLLQVVDAYGSSLTEKDLNQDNINYGFHKQMTNMLQNIVTEYDYRPEEMSMLKHHISKGACGHEEFEYMAVVVENAQAVNDDWRQHKPIKIPAITLTENSR